eukprot:NODE_1413_length_545_cov_48.308468_g1336_i0.p3 GENE.NODE_1413_length_545_cov_48.308468_g1336_i0~~NODE_1413_length_545_cov_48.308468_g1336_i0.p3  ORF type:complete len:55 (+),score=0.97 NODE_1413_length_545_cov_48.308468_g1336_i0:217-381(+)
MRVHGCGDIHMSRSVLGISFCQGSIHPQTIPGELHIINSINQYNRSIDPNLQKV